MLIFLGVDLNCTNNNRVYIKNEILSFGEEIPSKRSKIVIPIDEIHGERELAGEAR